MQNLEVIEDRFMRLKEILPMIGLTKSGWYKAIRSGRIEEPIKMGRVSLWKYSYIKQLMVDTNNGAGSMLAPLFVFFIIFTFKFLWIIYLKIVFSANLFENADNIF